MSGKKVRLARFVCPGRPSIIVPIDHGLTMGPLQGIGSTNEVAGWIGTPVIDGIIAHKGMIERLGAQGLLNRVGVMMHLNGMSLLSSNPDTKTRLTRIETAVRLGADAVSVQVNFDGSNDEGNLETLGAVVDDAAEFGLPVLAMVYDKVTSSSPRVELARARHLMRIAIELGIDAIKIGLPSDLSTLDELLAGVSSDIPVFFAGGQVSDPAQLMPLARRLTGPGRAAGLCVGRNVFQQSNPQALLLQLADTLRQPHVPTVAAASRRLKPVASALNGKATAPRASLAVAPEVPLRKATRRAR